MMRLLQWWAVVLSLVSATFSLEHNLRFGYRQSTANASLACSQLQIDYPTQVYLPGSVSYTYETTGEFFFPASLSAKG